MSKQKQKPDKDPWFLFYIVWPILDGVDVIVGATKWAWRKLTSAWWCDHCETYHTRRTHKFIYVGKVQRLREALQNPNKIYVCSLGKTERRKGHG